MKSINKSLVIVAMASLQTFAQATIYEPFVLWDKSDIKVCFFNKPEQIIATKYRLDKKSLKEQEFTPSYLSNDEKNEIRTLVQETYTKEKTGITFTGFKNCSEEANYDVMIIKAKNIKRILKPDISVPFGGRSSIGREGIYSEQGFVETNPTIKPTVLFTEMSPYTINHEFGHLAGLRHEHAHPDAKTISQSCRYSNSSEILNSAVIKAYDPNSVMNYCRRLENRNLNLSPADEETLRSIYDNR